MKRSAIIIGVTVLLTATVTYAATTTFTDQDQIANWALNGVNEMQYEGVITGYEDGSFRPETFVSRQELALILQRYRQEIVVKEANQSFSAYIDDVIENTQKWSGKGYDYETGIIMAESGLRRIEGEPFELASLEEDQTATLPVDYTVYKSVDAESQIYYLHFQGVRLIDDVEETVNQWYGPF